jgi:hypothetical protein
MRRELPASGRHGLCWSYQRGKPAYKKQTYSCNKKRESYIREPPRVLLDPAVNWLTPYVPHSLISCVTTVHLFCRQTDGRSLEFGLLDPVDQNSKGF